MVKIISIHSFRGGTGKSNTTANVAAVLATKGLFIFLPKHPWPQQLYKDISQTSQEQL